MNLDKSAPTFASNLVKRHQPTILTQPGLSWDFVSFAHPVAALTFYGRVVRSALELPESEPTQMPLLTEGKQGATISRTQAGPALDGRDRGQRWSARIYARDE